MLSWSLCDQHKPGFSGSECLGQPHFSARSMRSSFSFLKCKPLSAVTSLLKTNEFFLRFDIFSLFSISGLRKGFNLSHKSLYDSGESRLNGSAPFCLLLNWYWRHKESGNMFRTCATLWWKSFQDIIDERIRFVRMPLMISLTSKAMSKDSEFLMSE